MVGGAPVASGTPPLRFERAELLREDDYAQPHVEAGRRLHGGFDREGRYCSPRMRVRGPAVRAWTDALHARDGAPLAADASLLAGTRYPSPAQSRLLLLEGIGQGFWNTLTITGRIEARGRILADMTFPDFQAVVVEDITETALGHVHRGLLEAHGLDEGGEPARGIGGHDAMWFALRDLAFGDVGWAEPAVPETIGRPEGHKPPPPPIAPAYGRLLDFLMNLLLIEFRAERGFALAETLLRDPALFTGRRAEAERAADIVDRIRQDEQIHVDSLRLYLGEVRSLTFRTTDGGTIAGAAIIDEQWRRLVEWATVVQPPLLAEQQRALCRERIAGHPDAARVQRAFDALEEESYDGR
jgi:hypothetical protein